MTAAREDSHRLRIVSHAAGLWSATSRYAAVLLLLIALFVGVYHWNDYFTGVIFINKPALQPIQTFLYRVISETSSIQMLEHAVAGMRSSEVSSTSLKLATMVITTAPIICIYPFLQKYFVKGLLLGSIKG